MPNRALHPCNAPRCARLTTKRFCDDHQKASDRRQYEHRRAHGATQRIIEPLAVFERDGWICRLCYEPIDRTLKKPDPRSASMDHITPLALGGTHTTDNVQAAHLSCNSRKAAR